MTSKKDWIEDLKRDDYDFIVEQCARYHLDEPDEIDLGDDETTAK
jgi:hypothetical protein